MTSKRREQHDKKKKNPPVSAVTKSEDHVEGSELKEGEVLMKFSEHKYYTDQDTPIFYAGKTYKLEGAAWIERWLKRGGTIVEGEAPVTPQEPVNLSEVVGSESAVVSNSEKVEDGDKAEDAE